MQPPKSLPAPRRGIQDTLAVHLRYAFEEGEQRGASLGNPLFDLLAAVLEHGSIRHAAHSLGVSYRHFWGALRKWEKAFGEPLIVWSQGRRARPTAFAEKLLWAERRARIRLQPHIEALRADLARVIAEARDPKQHLLKMRASHDLALPALQQHVAETADLHLDLGFQGSVDALRALNDQQCLVAGFHVPALRGAATAFSRALKPLLKPRVHALIGCSLRMQGLMVRQEHAGQVRTFADVVRHALRFVNRQPGSGTRMLVEHLMNEHTISARELRGGRPEHVENTHVAVALCVASAVADAGVGIESAALEYGLHFIPLTEEEYFLACLQQNLHAPAIGKLRSVLAGNHWHGVLANLKGYRSSPRAGLCLVLEDILPWWKRRTRPLAGIARG